MSDTKMIKISKNFQTSVNISYDLRNKEKIRNFIPTTESISLIEEFFESVASSSTNRAHILIGAYGKGKSHIVLEALNLLFEKDKSLFSRLLEKIKTQNSGLFDDIENYLASERKILPIIINGSSASLSQSFLFSLYSALKENNLEKFMPDTNFSSALTTIQNWKVNFPQTYEELKNHLNIGINDFISRLENFDFETYQEFERIYPKITSGSVFNPFANYDIVELYENVSKKLSASDEGFCGVFVVYDEFSKYLESSISKASINDIKLLQDFAEKCSRSAAAGNKNQLHLLLISHKEFSNYIDNLPKEKVDGWKGVSERFKHIVLNSDYSEVYEVIGEVLEKDEKLWNEFLENHKSEFEDEKMRKTNQKMFGFDSKLCDFVSKNCFPLSPASSYILPRLSEKIAQNERTMFTFLSGNEKTSLPSLLENWFLHCENENEIRHCEYENEIRHCEERSDEAIPETLKKKFHLFTPDVLFDYFENQLKSESYTSQIKKIYTTAKKCLESAEKGSLESKIIKTLCLIYCLEQFERLSPTVETLSDIFVSGDVSIQDVGKTVENLVKKNLLYQSRSNDFLILKENLNFDLNDLILNTIEKRRHKVTEIEILNRLNTEKYLYPVEYNVKNDMTRYFEFKFCTKNEIVSALNFDDFGKNADGIALGIIFDDDENESSHAELVSASIKSFAKNLSKKLENSLVIIQKNQNEQNKKAVFNDLRTLDAIDFLKAENAEDKILCDELALIQEDLSNSVQNFIQKFTRPENDESLYFAFGSEQKIFRRANLDSILSKICEKCFSKTPKINNETLNKNILTGAADKSRRILTDAILSAESANLGITGGQELSFMRSALCVSKIAVVEPVETTTKYFDTSSEKIDENFRNLFCVINDFIEKAKQPLNQGADDNDCPRVQGDENFSELISVLTDKRHKIGLRKGVIPIYLAVAFSKIKRNVVIKSGEIEVPLDAKTLCEITERPEDFTLSVVDFDKPKEIYTKELCKMFDERAFGEKDFEKITYPQIVNLMLDWLRSLSKYSREKRKNVPQTYISFINELKNAVSESQNFLFVKIPEIFKSTDFAGTLVEKIRILKRDYENFQNKLEDDLVKKTRKILKSQIENANDDETLCSLYKKFYEKLESKNPEIISHKFENSAEKIFVIFENCGNNERKLVKSLAVFLTGINTDDWNDSTEEIYEQRLLEFVKTLDDYAGKANALGIVAARSVPERNEVERRNEGESRNREKPDPKRSAGERPNQYQIWFADEENVNFDKIECSAKAKGLEAELKNIFDEYGQSVSAGEKRQVLMDVLRELCK